jgi:transketolase
VLADAKEGDDPEIILVATGSELSLAVAAHEQLVADGVHSRVVSMPSWYLFERQDRAYRDQVLPPGVRARVAVEAASPIGWHRWAGDDGDVVAMEGFGASAPAADVFKGFNLTAEEVAGHARNVIGAGS